MVTYANQFVYQIGGQSFLSLRVSLFLKSWLRPISSSFSESLTSDLMLFGLLMSIECELIEAKNPVSCC